MNTLAVASVLAALLAAGVLAAACGGEATSSAPNGKIAYGTDTGSREIYAVHSDGSGEQNLTRNPGSDVEPAWSPDGREIAFASDRDDNDEIYVMNADGSGPRRLTENPAGDVCPTWSPDGRRIAFVSDRDGDREIYVMNADGSGHRNLTRNRHAEDTVPAWSPNRRKG